MEELHRDLEALAGTERRVAMATLVAYASLQGILFGLSYRAAYGGSLAPVYTCMAILFGLLALFGWRTGEQSVLYTVVRAAF